MTYHRCWAGRYYFKYAPENVEFYTVIPKELTESIELSDELEERKIQVANMILTRLADLGVKVTPQTEFK